VSALSNNTFVDVEISAAGETDWYKFTAQSSKTYLVTWNTDNSIYSNYGDGIKTLSLTSVYAFKADGTPLFSDRVNGWSTSGEYVRTISNYSGTYAIKYTEQ
jgi:hypothetical protein